ncbi:unnamed protein product [Vicia faba]|uniref:Uncharacterized protein n=1 Tax=Vicia faba TaxID=3906 RepID=A0AAV1B7L5_VICFA|nr:unnamed protein product [Vicia faba]
MPFPSNLKSMIQAPDSFRTKDDKEIKPNESIQKVTDVRTLNDSLEEKQCHLTDQPTLKKGVSHAKKYECALYLSSEESKASDTIMHYFYGKPVIVDYEGGSKVIHCHKNCTEWAPNVYFKDDNAINFEVAISRSWRSKCSFVDLKELHLVVMRKIIARAFMILVPSRLLDVDGIWKFLSCYALYMPSKLPYESSGSHHRNETLAATKAKSWEGIQFSRFIYNKNNRKLQHSPENYLSAITLHSSTNHLHHRSFFIAEEESSSILHLETPLHISLRFLCNLHPTFRSSSSTNLQCTINLYRLFQPSRFIIESSPSSITKTSLHQQSIAISNNLYSAISNNNTHRVDSA